MQGEKFFGRPARRMNPAQRTWPTHQLMAYSPINLKLKCSFFLFQIDPSFCFFAQDNGQCVTGSTVELFLQVKLFITDLLIFHSNFKVLVHT